MAERNVDRIRSSELAALARAGSPLAERIYVSIDLETTGLDSTREQIIEIGAVKFQGDRILETFETFVDPQRPIPPFITQITGIRNADVAGAPVLAEIVPELKAFVGHDVAAVMAHNVKFDLGFLRAGGVDFRRPAYDTQELATILLPGQASYSLAELCHTLDIALPDHRALNDARATSQLFWQLSLQASLLPQPLFDLLLESAARAEAADAAWPNAQFFADAAQRARRAGLWHGAPAQQNGQTGRQGTPAPPLPLATETGEQVAAAETGETPESGETRETSETSETSETGETPEPGETVGVAPLLELAGPVQPVPEAVLLAYFADDGPLAAQLGTGFERRSGQIAMAAQVLHAFNSGDYLLIEAGTGTGKSLAYLLPSALFALANGRRVTIATNTIALQDQLMEKDIPQVQALLAQLPPPGVESTTLRAALLKGRRHYICLRRLHMWRASHALAPLEMTVLAKVLVWLALIGEGDAGGITMNTPAERAIWQRICSDAATCSEDRCGVTAFADMAAEYSAARGVDLHGALDFYWQARLRAEAAQLVVVNHALLLADVAAGGRVLPPSSHLIVDEAYRLEEAATEQMTYRVEWPAVQLLLRRLLPEGDLFSQLRRTADHLGHAAVLEMLPGVAQRTQRTAQALLTFAEQLTQFARSRDEARSEGGGGYAQRIALDGTVRSQPDWSRIEVEWGETRTRIQRLVETVESLVQQLEAARWGQREPAATLLAELAEVHAELVELSHQMDEILLAPGGARQRRVAWMESGDSSAAVTLALAPLTVNEVLEQQLLLRQRCAIFTGATLRTGSSFRYIRDRLGLWDVKIATVDSPFDYKKSTLLYLPTDMPLPNQPHYQQMVEQAIVEAAVACEGRSLVLFTSYQQLRATADAVRGSLERRGVTLLQHGQGSRYRLLREYRQQPQAVLFGTRSFWEGIDLPGEELSCLLIARLPFAVPNDPLVAARSADFDDPFQEYTVPDAVLRFRQGFGRLIRRAGDRGVVVLLDARVWRKDYGATFLESLPECTMRRMPMQNLGREVRTWLGRGKAGGR